MPASPPSVLLGAPAHIPLDLGGQSSLPRPGRPQVTLKRCCHAQSFHSCRRQSAAFKRIPSRPARPTTAPAPGPRPPRACRLPRDRFFQFLWRPRPPSLLSEDALRALARNLKKYSKRYDEEDEALLMQVGAPLMRMSSCR